MVQMRLRRGFGLPAKMALVAAIAALLVLFAAAVARADELAYSCEEDICVIDPDHPASHVNLTETSQNDDLHPAWSPDGNTIAFGADYSGNGDIYLTSPGSPGVGLDITNTTAVSEGIPRWSPDGSRIAYVGTTTPGNDLNVYVSPSSGASVPVAIGETAAEEREPTWSPDGSELAFARSTSIYLSAPVAGATAQPLANGAGLEPVWSPDGTVIAATDAYSDKVRLIDADGSGQATELPVPSSLYNGISWSPDSKQVVYRDENDEIRVAPTNPVGPGYTIKLPAGVIVPLEPKFSPDGSRIAFIARHNAGNEYDQIFIAAAMPGAEAVQLTEAAQSALYPTWKPGSGATIPPPPVITPGTGGGTTGTGSGTAKKTEPKTIKFAAFQHPFVYHEGLSVYVDCSLGSTNEACHFHGEATYVQPITHSLTYAGSKGKRPKAMVVASGSVSVPGGEKKLLKLKLNGAGRKLAKPGHTLKLAVTITETAPGAKPVTKTQTVQLKIPKKKG